MKFWYLQLCNHQFSERLVLQIKFDDRALKVSKHNLSYSDRYFKIDRQPHML